MQLKRIVEESDRPAGKAFDLGIQFLIVASLISFSVETLPDLEGSTRRALKTFEAFSIFVFTIEYGLRLYVADRRMRFVFSFFGIIDLLAIMPFYLSLGIDLRSLRALRLLRLFRIFKLARYGQAVQRFRRALLIAREELILFFCLTLILIYLSAVGIYYFEKTAQPEIFSSVPQSLWWAVATLTTVGYGDVYPITAGGKLFTFIILMLGLGVIAAPAGIIASALAKARESD